ncbi:peptidylprolyl isomerase [Mucilaginibacter auburnensis]|uniref:Periplasmic chaperone PpiD n=1 Tax=Mucilaginibacter auburnensis TaxID=1457233 RepID=A0A2H9VT20_9SPHI|nr:peptidylprolyl isomerase [Mucilaginibacter auburnensis]PJJ83971.1 peptidyl-prolyl cis-trans isomerase D [Mucilaginibacter auburnensis]
MGIMGYLRERMGKIVAGVIGISLIAFVITEVVQSGGSFFRDDNSTIGEVYGEKIPYQEFNETVEQNSNQFKEQSGGALSPQITAYIQENTWNQMLSKAMISHEADAVGLQVTGDESQAMISGSNPSPEIVRAFTNPQTGQFDRASLTSTISKLRVTPDVDPQKQRWKKFVQELVENKLAEKYMTGITNGLYVNSLEAKDDYEAKNKLANFKYAVLDYQSVQDSKVTLTDADYSSYYEEHKNEFKNQQETRGIEFVTFNGAPSKADSAAVKASIEKLKPEFSASTNDSLFVQINSETKQPFAYRKKGELGSGLDSVMFNAAPGFVYGPYTENGHYALAKLIDSRVGPDSVTAKHILLAPGDGIKKADSLKALIQGGKSFAEMAKMYSMDQGSAAKGGDVGTFARGAMVPAFEDAAFNGKPGDYKIVTSQFGVHLIYIVAQKGSSKVVKVAVVDKPLNASSETQSAAYSKAQQFLINVNDGDFNAQAKKAGLEVKNADDVTGSAASLPGLESARELVRWAFNAEKGDVYDQVYTSGDQYVVARLTAIKPQGILPLDAVKKQIEPMVRVQVKAKMLTDKFNGALSGAATIEQAAQKAGATVNAVQNIVLANPVIPGVGAGPEYKLIGTIFGSQVNKLSKPVQGQQGVFIFSVNSFVNPAALANNITQKQQLLQGLVQRSQGEALEALKNKANVKDYRARLL